MAAILFCIANFGSFSAASFATKIQEECSLILAFQKAFVYYYHKPFHWVKSVIEMIDSESIWWDLESPGRIIYFRSDELETVCSFSRYSSSHNYRSGKHQTTDSPLAAVYFVVMGYSELIIIPSYHNLTVPNWQLYILGAKETMILNYPLIGPKARRTILEQYRIVFPFHDFQWERLLASNLLRKLSSQADPELCHLINCHRNFCDIYCWRTREQDIALLANEFEVKEKCTNQIWTKRICASRWCSNVAFREMQYYHEKIAWLAHIRSHKRLYTYCTLLCFPISNPRFRFVTSDTFANIPRLASYRIL